MLIKKITKIKCDEKIPFYDITVENYHNFFISNSKILVHNSALANSINRMARPFDCAEQILIGDGFFGSQVNQEAASSRYTSVAINEKIEKIIKKYHFLNKKDKHDNYDYLRIDVPVGLLLPCMGIAVGYRTMILPRQLKHIEEFLEGKRKTLKPYFIGFNGKIDKYNNLENSWLMEGEVIVNEQNFSIHIKSIPPLMKYENFIKKIGKILDGTEFKLSNNSGSSIDITIKLNNIDTDKWGFIKNKILKSSKLIFKESLVFIKDRQVLEYETIEDYLEDFKIKNHFLKKEEMIHHIRIYNEELEFLLAKLKFLNWMSDKKKRNAYLSEDEVLKFISQFGDKIAKRLDEIKLRKLNDDETKKTELFIKEYKTKIKDTTLLFKEHEKFLKTMPLKLHTKNRTTITLFEENKNEIDDIEIFSVDETIEIEEEIEE